MVSMRPSFWPMQSIIVADIGRPLLVRDMQPSQESTQSESVFYNSRTYPSSIYTTTAYFPPPHLTLLHRCKSYKVINRIHSILDLDMKARFPYLLSCYASGNVPKLTVRNPPVIKLYSEFLQSAAGTGESIGIPYPVRTSFTFSHALRIASRRTFVERWFACDMIGPCGL